jgi:peptide/nickel transport system substrate-binding protein
MKNKFYLSLILLILTLHGCTRGQKGPTNLELKIGISQEFENPNPLIMTMLATTYLSGLVIRPLTVMDAQGQWIPLLAKSIPTLGQGAEVIIENGQKKMKVLWEIKENAGWGDGTSVTCADFAFSRSIAINPLVAIPEKENYASIERIDFDQSTPRKCFFIYKTVRWDFSHIGTIFPVAKHLEDSVYQQFKDQPEGYEKNTTYGKNPTTPGLYNGPYVISEIKLGSHIVLRPNPHFYGSKPAIQKLIIKIIPNTGTLEANLRSRQIDMISSIGFSLDEAIAFEKKIKADQLPFVVHFKPSQTFEHIDVNLENPILKDLRLRQAMMHAMNRTDLTNALFEGRQTPALHFVSSIDPWFTNDPQVVTAYAYSKEKANKLLDEAGWKMGQEGIRLKNGTSLSFTISTTSENKTRELIEQYLKDQWRQVGINLEIKNEPARVFFGETVRKSQFEGLAMYALISSSENIPISTLHSRSIPSASNGWSGQNLASWRNPTVDAALQQLKTEFDGGQRLKLIHSIIKEYTTELPVLPLYYRSDVAVAPKDLHGYQLTGHQFMETYFAENWTFSKSDSTDNKSVVSINN